MQTLHRLHRRHRRYPVCSAAGACVPAEEVRVVTMMMVTCEMASMKKKRKKMAVRTKATTFARNVETASPTTITLSSSVTASVTWPTTRTVQVSMWCPRETGTVQDVLGIQGETNLHPSPSHHHPPLLPLPLPPRRSVPSIVLAVAAVAKAAENPPVPGNVAGHVCTTVTKCAGT